MLQRAPPPGTLLVAFDAVAAACNDVCCAAEECAVVGGSHQTRLAQLQMVLYQLELSAEPIAVLGLFE
ncbi:hypothetical protein HBI41_244170 [Parastagonospora nodorum]|nr:hypothetical protein HBI41_244170 [Parastagonospora nodorum]